MPTATEQARFEEILRDKNKQKVSGRRAYLQMIDYLLAEPQSIEILYSAAKTALEEAPLQFVKEHVHPLLPKETNETIETAVPLKIELLPLEPTRT